MSAEAETAVENALEEGNEDAEDEDIEAMKRKVAEIEAEYERLKGQNDDDLDGDGEGNLDDSVTPESLQEFFKACGTINRITIMCDKYTGQPKGFAYMEFEEKEAVELACGLDETEMNGKPISVKPKRQNLPKFLRGRGRGRGRGGFRGRGRGRGRGGFRGGFRGRGRGRGRYNPY